MPKNKGKLVCKVGNLALLIEYTPSGSLAPNFKFATMDGTTNAVVSTATLSIVDAVFLSKCLNTVINECMSRDIKASLPRGTKDGKPT